MADGDNRAQYQGTATGSINKEVGPGVAKGDPVAMDRPAEGQERADFYAGVGVAETQKDELPEHQARREAYPLITAANS